MFNKFAESEAIPIRDTKESDLNGELESLRQNPSVLPGDSVVRESWWLIGEKFEFSIIPGLNLLLFPLSDL